MSKAKKFVCPYCGKEMWNNKNDDGWSVNCPTCGLGGPYGKNKSAATQKFLKVFPNCKQVDDQTLYDVFGGSYIIHYD